MALVTDIQADNFVWDAIIEHLPASRKKGVGKFDINIHCPMCVLRGEPRPDQFHRCGLKRNGTGLGINCFNCKFKTRWNIGEQISKPLAAFLEELGMSDTDVKRLAHRALVIARTYGGDAIERLATVDNFRPEFPTMVLPKGARSLGAWLNDGCSDPRLLRCVEYIASRGRDIATRHDYFWTPDAGDSMALRVIIPMYFSGRLVGWTGRDSTGTLDRKYHADTPPDFLMNNHLMDETSRVYLPVIEGPFDAIGITGLSTLGAKMSDNQARWINSAGKKPILIVDRDHSGIQNIDVALRNKWHVAFPRLASAGWWDSNVKDVGQAVELYGRLYVIKSILETMTNETNKIEVWSKLLI